MKKSYFLFISCIFLLILTGCSDNDSFASNDSQGNNATSLTDDEKDVLSHAFKSNHTINLDDAKYKAEEAFASLLSENGSSLKSTTKTPKITKVQILSSPKSLTKSTNNSDLDVLIPDTVAYMFGFGEDEGFAMIAADERIEEAVLACTNSGTMPDEIVENEAMGFFLDNAGEYIVNQLEIAKQKEDSLLNGIIEKLKTEMPEEFADLEEGANTKSFLSSILNLEVVTSTNATSWRTINSQSHFVPVEWGQQDPYWNYVKNKKSCGTVRTGCVATAVAQLMAYWRFPTSLEGVTFNWRNLTSKTYIDSYNSQDADLRHQVAFLIKRIGENSNMDYGCNSSGTKTYKGRNYMNKLGYTGGSESKYNFNTVMSSLNAARPVLARGDRTFKYIKIFGKKIGYTTNGHAWIIDGYVQKYRKVEQVITLKNRKTGKIIKTERKVYTQYSSFIHNNWGWNGSYNGWFAEGCFDSNNGQVADPRLTKSFSDEMDFDAGSSGNYQYNNKIYHNLAPRR